LKLYNNIYDDIQASQGFSKEIILEIKNNLMKLKSAKKSEGEIEDYLSNYFKVKTINSFSEYVSNISTFWDRYLSIQPYRNESYYFNLKSKILNEFKIISNHLLNLKMNEQNINRILKNNTFMNGYSKDVIQNLENISALIVRLQDQVKKPDDILEDAFYLWGETNKIRNLKFKFNELPDDLKIWDDINEIHNLIKNLDISRSSKKKKKRSKESITCYFNELFKIYSEKHETDSGLFSEIIFLLYSNNFCNEDESEYINVLERKELKKELKNFIRPIVKEVIQRKLKEFLEEIAILDENYDLSGEGKSIDIDALIKEKISIFLPKIANYYVNGLEKKYQEQISNISKFDEFKKVKHEYSEKLEKFMSIMEGMDKTIDTFESYLKPFDDINVSLKKIFSNINSEISRRKEEYLIYLKTIKLERQRDNIRKFVSDKILEVNHLINSYQDEASIIIREEFPQLKHISEILRDYKLKMEKIKDEVYQKLNRDKEKNGNLYQVIKQWEDNLSSKTKQLSFLLSILLNKLFKNFKDLIEEEEELFDSITHITKISQESENEEDLPLNISLSSSLADKLTENELKQRIVEFNSKINKLSKELVFYQEELTKLNELLTTKVKIREGIFTSDVQCSVCHKLLNFSKDEIIKCPFCGAVYHYLCVAFWLSKYNSCPTCQNAFLDPNSGLFES